MKHIIFPQLEDGSMPTPCAENINGMGMGYSFEVAEFEAEDLNNGEFGYQFKATDDDLDIVFPDGKVERAKGKVVKLSKNDMQPILDAEKLEQKQSLLLANAKNLIGSTIVAQVGAITDQLNAGTTASEDIKSQWKAKFELRDKIKFVDGKRLKDAVRNAKTSDDLTAIEATMTNDSSGWANA